MCLMTEGIVAVPFGEKREKREKRAKIEKRERRERREDMEGWRLCEIIQ
jgi:hypothetical protein